MKILITGAAGFVSRAFVTELEQSPQAHELILLDRVQPAAATVFVPGSDAREAAPLDVRRWPYVQAEILDSDAMQRVLVGVDAVVHLAAAVSGHPQFGVETFRVNTVGTYILLDAARQQGVQRVIVASSINAFGTFYWRLSGQPVHYDHLPLDETFPPIPEDPYSLSKLVNEETCAAFSRAYGLRTAAMRFGVVWSEAMYHEAVTAGLPATTEWSADLFSWVHIADIARGLRQALEAPDLPAHGVYTLSGADTRCPEPTLELLERFHPELIPPVATSLSGRAPLLSIARAQRAFAYQPRFHLGQ